MTHLPLRFPEKKLKRPSLFPRAGERGRSFSSFRSGSRVNFSPAARMQDILHRQAPPPPVPAPEAAKRSPAGRFGCFDRKKPTNRPKNRNARLDRREKQWYNKALIMSGGYSAILISCD